MIFFSQSCRGLVRLNPLYNEKIPSKMLSSLKNPLKEKIKSLLAEKFQFAVSPIFTQQFAFQTSHGQ